MQKKFELMKNATRFLLYLSLALFFVWRAEVSVDPQGMTGLLEQLMCFMLAMFLILAGVAHSAGDGEAA